MSRPDLFSLEAERAVLGILVNNPGLLYEAHAWGLRGEHFYRTAHGLVYDELSAMAAEGQRIDGVTFPERVVASPKAEHMGGLSYVVSLVADSPPQVGLQTYVRLVLDRWQRRATLAALEGSLSRLYDLNGTHAEQAQTAVVDAVQGVTLRPEGSWTGQEDAIEQTMQATVIEPGERGRRAFTSTGFPDLDAVVSGLYPSDLVLLAARPSMGKSALALNIAENVARAGVRVGVFSLEMPKESLVQRMLAGVGNVPLHVVRNGVSNDADLYRLQRASAELRPLPIHYDDASGLSVGELVARATRLRNLHGDLGLLVVDYLQLLEADHRSGSREQDVAHISKRLKGWAKDAGVPVLALCQLSRACEERKDKRPQLSDLRESGSLEQDADQVWMVFRPSQYWPEDPTLKGWADVLIVKNRNGVLGDVRLRFYGDRTKFDTMPKPKQDNKQQTFNGA